MIRFEYLHFICEQDELQGTLTLRGEEGWRLHTCEPVVTMGPNGSGAMSAFVVMDQAIQEEEEQEYDNLPHFDDDEGLKMKG